MEQILQKIKETEKEANAIIAEARAKASSIMEENKKKMDTENSALVEYRKKEIESHIADAQKEFEKAKKEIDKEWNTLEEKIKNNAKQRKSEIVKHIINEVVK